MGLDMFAVFVIVCYVGGALFLLPFLAMALVYLKGQASSLGYQNEILIFDPRRSR